MATTIEREYAMKIKDYINTNLLHDGTPIEIASLTNDKEKFIATIKYLIRNYIPELELSSDLTKIRLNPAEFIPETKREEEIVLEEIEEPEEKKPTIDIDDF